MQSKFDTIVLAVLLNSILFYNVYNVRQTYFKNYMYFLIWNLITKLKNIVNHFTVYIFSNVAPLCVRARSSEARVFIIII